ncbi:replication protein RepA [Alteromonas sp. IB21]|uniref:replication protein RepA n=1 Tax=Alteromonas sp. IB21 TaxID=2779369 RepID=UPI0018E8C44A|nr:replication protein RepA [Alteromonas sp. IB21]MBJ2127774.1 replication protein RepA [Alteromonas sp. IB21]
MSLLNLKKSKPLAKPNLRTVEDFIDDALHYAQGKVNARDQVSVVDQRLAKEKSVKPCASLPDRVVSINNTVDRPVKEGMRHATFTLTPQCIDKLADISEKTGKAKSALIREWINAHS